MFIYNIKYTGLGWDLDSSFNFTMSYSFKLHNLSFSHIKIKIVIATLSQTGLLRD